MLGSWRSCERDTGSFSHERPPLSDQPLPMPSYTPSSIRGKALEKEFQDLLHKRAIEQAPQTPGFYSRLFVVQKDSGAWRPIIDLSTLNTYIASQHFHMETPQSVLRSIRQGDWMISLDLQDAYLQVPVHPESRRYLRFTMRGVPYQFRVLCFGLTTAPQVFTRLMAPISAILHRYGIRMLRYLDDWLILAESRTTCLQARDRLLQVCEELGLQVNFRKSSLVPSQDMTYLGMQILSVRFVAKPTESRVVNLLNIIEEFLSSPDPPAALWRRLLGHLSSLTLLVKGGMLRMRSLQIRLRSRWDFRDELLRIAWDPLCQEDLLWWSWAIQQREGVDLSLPVPDLSFYSDASDVGWGAIVGEHQVSGVWTPSQRELSINLREMMAVQKGLLRVQLSSQRQDDRSLLRQCHDSRLPQAIGRHEVSGPVPQGEGDSPVGRIYEDHASSPVHPGVSQHESGSSQSAQPGDRIGVDTTPGGGPGSSPPVAGDHRPIRDLTDSKAPSVLCSSVGTQGSGGRCIPPALDNLQAYAFPPIAIIRRVLLKLRASHHCDLTLIAPFWPQREWFPDLLELLSDIPIELPKRRDLLRQPHFHRFHENLPMLRLTAWRLSSDSPVRQASLKQWLANLPSVGGNLLD